MIIGVAKRILNTDRALGLEGLSACSLGGDFFGVLFPVDVGGQGTPCLRAEDHET